MKIHSEDQSAAGAAALREGREFLVIFLVHCGDLSNPVAPTFKTAQQWAKLVCAEFTHQVEAEKEGGMPVTAWMDNLDTPVAIAKLQVGFYSYVCKPLWTAAARMLPVACGPLLENINRNTDQWKALTTVGDEDEGK
jgi:hypothetical protein